jgi:hypothetical protein
MDAWSRFGSLQGQEIFPFSTVFKLALGPSRSRSEADYTPSTAKVNNGGIIPSLPHTSSWCGASLNKHRAKFTLLCV